MICYYQIESTDYLLFVLLYLKIFISYNWKKNTYIVYALCNIRLIHCIFLYIEFLIKLNYIEIINKLFLLSFWNFASRLNCLILFHILYENELWLVDHPCFDTCFYTHYTLFLSSKRFVPLLYNCFVMASWLQNILWSFSRFNFVSFFKKTINWKML